MPLFFWALIQYVVSTIILNGGHQCRDGFNLLSLFEVLLVWVWILICSWLSPSIFSPKCSPQTVTLTHWRRWDDIIGLQGDKPLVKEVVSCPIRVWPWYFSAARPPSIGNAFPSEGLKRSSGAGLFVQLTHNLYLRSYRNTEISVMDRGRKEHHTGCKQYAHVHPDDICTLSEDGCACPRCCRPVLSHVIRSSHLCFY